jgi:hypothetical protein
MADRQPSPEELRLLDLLYGELEGEEEAAALREVEGDADRAGEMAAFSRVRSLLRDLPEEEPPAAISAQLLHAAAKAAPAPRPADERPGLWTKLKGWFSPVLMHPAISAAAMFVVVVGVAGALYMTGNFDKAEPRARSAATPPPAAERDDRARFQDEAPPAGAAQIAPGSLDLPTTPSGDDIAVDGKDVAGEPLAGNGDGEATEKQTKPARRGAGGGTKGGLIVADPKPDPAKNDKKKLELDNNAPAPVAEPPADPAPVTTGSSGDRDMIENEEPPAEQSKAPAPTKKPPTNKPAPQPSAPPPAPPPQSQPPPDDARANYNRAVELHKRALQAARDGECDAIADIGKTVRNLDLNYYNTKYRNDARLTGCQKPPAPKSPAPTNDR